MRKYKIPSKGSINTIIIMVLFVILMHTFHTTPVLAAGECTNVEKVCAVSSFQEEEVKHIVANHCRGGTDKERRTDVGLPVDDSRGNPEYKSNFTIDICPAHARYEFRVVYFASNCRMVGRSEGCRQYYDRVKDVYAWVSQVKNTKKEPVVTGWYYTKDQKVESTEWERVLFSVNPEGMFKVSTMYPRAPRNP